MDHDICSLWWHLDAALSMMESNEEAGWAPRTCRWFRNHLEIDCSPQHSTIGVTLEMSGLRPFQ